MRMLNFSDLQQRPVHEQLFTFADAYLDSAEVLCLRLCSQEQPATYAHGAVIMSLAFHSLELLFKAGILKAAPGEKFSGKSGHDLTALSAHFFKLYPCKDFQFELPFRFELAEPVEPLSEEELVALRAYVRERENQMPLDQLHRYPVGVNGKSWEGIFGFEPHMFLQTLRDLKDIYNRIRPVLNSG